MYMPSLYYDLFFMNPNYRAYMYLLSHLFLYSSYFLILDDADTTDDDEPPKKRRTWEKLDVKLK